MRRTASNRRARAALLLGLACFFGSSCESCLKRQPRDSVESLPYPTCPDGSDAGVGETLAEGILRAGPVHATAGLIERYRVFRRGCHIVATVRQEWSRQIDDVEVVFDLDYRPIRAWKRMSIPSENGSSPLVDIRSYELRTLPVSMTGRVGRDLRHWIFKMRERPIAVVGPGRGLLTAWIRAQDLAVDASVAGPVLDFREAQERVDRIALRRERDQDLPGVGRVRAYTVYGRETVFTDATGAVVGDLAGLRPAAVIGGDVPAPMPTDGEPDPIGTP